MVFSNEEGIYAKGLRHRAHAGMKFASRLMEVKFLIKTIAWIEPMLRGFTDIYEQSLLRVHESLIGVMSLLIQDVPENARKV